jgi:hypothetical protein
MPAKPESRSRRASQTWGQQCFTVKLTNIAIMGIRQLWKGKLDNTILDYQEGKYRLEVSKNNAGVEEELVDRIGKRKPPSNRPIGDAAIQRLRGERGMNPPSGKVAAFDFHTVVKKLEENIKKGIKAGPQKGDMFPSHWEHCAIPQPGSKPVDICKVSRRAARYLQNYQTEMLRANREEVMEQSGIQSYMDVHFKDPRNLKMLALRMGRAGMLRAVSQRQGGLQMFTVVKKFEIIDEKPKITLRLIFDERLENAGWNDPPWVALGGVASLAQLDVSEEMQGGNVEVRYATGDVPD